MARAFHVDQTGLEVSTGQRGLGLLVHSRKRGNVPSEGLAQHVGFFPGFSVSKNMVEGLVVDSP